MGQIMQIVFTHINGLIIFVEVILLLLKGAEFINLLPRLSPSKVFTIVKTIIQSYTDVATRLKIRKAFKCSYIFIN